MASTATTFIGSINTAFPQAGVDNDTQGFRDNYANIKNGMTALANEVSSIQADGVVKNATNNFAGTGIIQQAVLDSVSIKTYTNSVGVIGGNQIVDFTSGNFQIWKITSSTNFSFVNFPESRRGIVQLQLYRDINTTSTVNVSIVASTTTSILLDTHVGEVVTNPIALTTSSPVIYEIASNAADPSSGEPTELFVKFVGGPFKA